MNGFPFASTLRADKTLAAALGFVALFGLAELGAVAFYYAARTHAAYKVSQPSAAISSVPLPASEESAPGPAENPSAAINTVAPECAAAADDAGRPFASSGAQSS